LITASPVWALGVLVAFAVAFFAGAFLVVAFFVVFAFVVGFFVVAFFGLAMICSFTFVTCSYEQVIKIVPNTVVLSA